MWNEWNGKLYSCTMKTYNSVLLLYLEKYPRCFIAVADSKHPFLDFSLKIKVPWLQPRCQHTSRATWANNSFSSKVSLSHIFSKRWKPRRSDTLDSYYLEQSQFKCPNNVVVVVIIRILFIIWYRMSGFLTSYIHNPKSVLWFYIFHRNLVYR